MGVKRGWLGFSPSHPLVVQVHSEMVTDSMKIGSTGRSIGPVSVVAILSTTALDSSSTTLPKIVCAPWSQVVGATVMKNWEPLVPLPMRLPALAMARTYGSVKVSSGEISSSNT